jgi:hypothetical protein
MPSVGPSPPPGIAEKRKRDDSDDNDANNSSRSASPDSSSKKPRVIGPAMPPAPLEERPAKSSSPVGEGSSEDDSSDDDFGPALPTAADAVKKATIAVGPTAPAPVALQRDEWMTMAPSSGDWSSRIDPTQLKARKFNTGKGAKAPATSGGSNDAWYETPEQKQTRLQRELMGVKDKGSGPAPPKAVSSKEDSATAENLKNYSVVRGPSLMDSHQKKQGREEDDDPSKRAFDREKDIAGGLQLNATQRRDMMKKASDFSSRFSSSNYL